MVKELSTIAAIISVAVLVLYEIASAIPGTVWQSFVRKSRAVIIACTAVGCLGVGATLFRLVTGLGPI